MTQPLSTFDSQAFQEIYDFFELKRQAKQAELNEEFAQELQRKQESQKSLFQCTVSYLTNLFN